MTTRRPAATRTVRASLLKGKTTLGSTCLATCRPRACASRLEVLPWWCQQLTLPGLLGQSLQAPGCATRGEQQSRSQGLVDGRLQYGCGSGRSRQFASFIAQVCEYGGSPPPCPHSDGEAGGGIGCGAVIVMLLLWSLVAGAAAGLRRFLTSTKLAPHQAARLSRKGEPRERSLCRSAAPEGTTPPAPQRPQG